MSNNDHARRALVTGSSSGIGEAIARRLLHDGWEVCGFDRAPAKLDAPKFKSVIFDLADAAALSRAVVAEQHVTALIHAAGYMRVAPLGKLDVDEGAGMWRLHVEAAALLANAIAPRHRERPRRGGSSADARAVPSWTSCITARGSTTTPDSFAPGRISTALNSKL